MKRKCKRKTMFVIIIKKKVLDATGNPFLNFPNLIIHLGRRSQRKYSVVTRKMWNEMEIVGWKIKRK